MAVICFSSLSFPTQIPYLQKKNKTHIRLLDPNDFSICCCSTEPTAPLLPASPIPALLPKRRKRYRKQYPGESKGIVEEMRFVAMRLRQNNLSSRGGEGAEVKEEEEASSSPGDNKETWKPTMEGFVKYLVDSKLVFNTLDRIVDESDHVDYAYFRKTGLERSQGLSKDLEWFSQQNIVIPPPSTAGISYSKYLDELSEKCPPSFLCHFYNIYFAHIAGGQVIGKQASEKLLDGRELEFYKWEGNMSEMLKDMREKLNKLGEHWSRGEKVKCLREAAKSFRFSGEIVRSITL